MRFNFLLVCGASLALIACGGNVDQQSDAQPIAKAEVVGTSVNTEDSIVVRSGSDVVLSGHGSDGIDDPILQFRWEQLSIDGYNFPVELYERTANSVVFTAPQVPVNQPEGIPLKFQLTIADADGATARDEIDVLVLPGADLNSFLLGPHVNEQFLIVLAAEEGVELANDIPLELEFSKTVNWVDRFGETHSETFPVSTFNGTVNAGISPAANSDRNLSFSTRLPLLDADEVNQFYRGQSRSGRLEFEDVEQASLNLNFSLTQFASGNISIHLAQKTEDGISLFDTSTFSSNATQLSVSEEWLRQQLNVESRQTANNYYNCIDPDGAAATLDSWIESAGFRAYPEQVEHVTYVNNFDLGFGRDMYFRKDENNNIYSYVVNYPNLENALTGRNEFAVVVMEFSEAPTGNCGDGTFAAADGKKIVKFYAYVPDEVTGEYVRAPSMNFDGRGERFLPGVCVVCHFGDTNVSDFNVGDLNSINAEAADLDSSFMLFDLDAFLYTSSEDGFAADPVYASEEVSSDLTNRYSRSAQEESFRDINQMVLDTFTYDQNNLRRFEIPIKAVHGWYGNTSSVEGLNFGSDETPPTEQEIQNLVSAVATLPSNNFNGPAYTPAGWQGQEDLYHDMFARNCRLCHLQIGNRAVDFDSYEEFINNENLVHYVYERGAMPLSRLTMDRFWIDYFSGLSGAEILREHLNNDSNPDNDVARDARPGFPVARITPGVNPELQADAIMDFDGFEVFEGVDSFFADNFEWRLDGSIVSRSNRYVFEALTPGTNHDLSLQVFNLTNATNSVEVLRRIAVRDNAPDPTGLPTPVVTEGDSVDINIFNGLCAFDVDSLACRSAFGDIRSGETPTISIVGLPRNGIIESVDQTNGIVRFTSTAAASDGDASFAFRLTDSFAEDSIIETLAIRVNALSGPQIGGPDNCSVNANTSQSSDDFPRILNDAECPNPILNDTAGSGLSLSLVAVDSSASRDGSNVVLNAEGLIEYTPGRFFIGNDSFSYTVEDDSLSANQSFGTVVVNVNASQTFSSLSTGDGVLNRNIPDSGCAECHDGTTAPDWRNIDNFRLVATNTEIAPYGSAEIALVQTTSTGDLLNSILFRMACNAEGLDHQGENRLCLSDGAPASIDDLNDDGRAVLTWIEEGMNNN